MSSERGAKGEANMGGVAREANFGQVADMEGGRPGVGFGLKEKRHSIFFIIPLAIFKAWWSFYET